MTMTAARYSLGDLSVRRGSSKYVLTSLCVLELKWYSKSANYVRTELPVRIAHRLRDMQTLPYVVVNQEGVASVYEAYWSAFDKCVLIRLLSK